MKPKLSKHFQSRMPSSIRLAQIEFLKRKDPVVAVNTAIGNVSLPMHPAMAERMFSLKSEKSPFRRGVLQYSTTVGDLETTKTFLHLIESSGFSSEGLYVQITDGGSHAMELVIIGVCGDSGKQELPLLAIDPIYSNYSSMAERTGRSIVTVTRTLEENGKFSLPQFSDIEKVIVEKNPGALLVIPYDNPTGQFFPQAVLNEIGKLCVKHNLWLISDEAYREMFYVGSVASSIWGITEEEVPGIQGRRISIESASKIWNACGLRIGAIITDSLEFHQKAVAENTANLCANAIGQYIFGALLHESKQQLQKWFQKQRDYYSQMAKRLTQNLKKEMPSLIVSSPDASLYTVVDVRKMAGSDFNAEKFVMYCAREGKVSIQGEEKTLLVAPMTGFYSKDSEIGKTQMRIAYVEPPEIMEQVPFLFSKLFSKDLLI